jgi:RND family efflux transporter MFP subunit
MKPSSQAGTPSGRGVLSRRNIVILTVTLALAGGAAIYFGSARTSSAEQKPRAQEPSITVDVVQPASTTFARNLAATGTVRARDELVLGSDASGVRLLEVLVDVGSIVQRGQLLARGDDATLQAQLAQQDAQIRQAQAELVQARANVERSERIRDSGVYSVETLQTRQTSAEAAAAKLELARAQRRELEVRIAQTRIVAPANGVISKRMATVGAVVQPGNELFRLIRDGQIEWLAELPSHSIAQVQPGAKARVALDDGGTVEATVRMIAPTIDAATRNGLVYATLPAGTRLRPGALAKGELLISDARVLSLPETSVLTRDGYAFVFVVGKDGVARQTRIETGTRQRGLVEINGGLDGETRVVTTGAGFVKDGDVVRLATDPAQRQATTESAARAGGQS